jgi:hypothetical protein
MLNHQKLLKTSFDASKWLTIHMNKRGIQHRIAPFPCNLQWFRDRKVSSKIAEVGLFFTSSNSRKALAASMLIIPGASEGNRTNPKMAKAII